MSAKLRATQTRGTSGSSSSAVTINAVFFEEVKEAHLEVSSVADRIESLGKRSDWNDTTCRVLTAQLHRLAETVRWYFSLEEAFGYFDDPVFVGAAYGQRVSDLRSEHEQLLAEVDQLGEHTARLLYNGRLRDSANIVLQRFVVFRDQMEQHELRERELITEAYSVDIGCGD